MSGAPALARERFSLPNDVIYLDGNSLGALPKATPERLRALMREEWRSDLIGSWTKNGWIDLPITVAAKLAPIVGAQPNELIVADSTSVTLFKLLAAAVAARPGRRVVLTDAANFPTDLYVVEGLSGMLGLEMRAVESRSIVEAIDDSVAAVTLTHVDFRSGERRDMGAINAAARAAGAINLWDLSHSAGAVALDLSRSGCDLAVGCGYKYLNGGPGAPAFLFCAERLQGELISPLQGWMGHADPFAFADRFEPAHDLRRFTTGTPPVLALAALECGIATFDGFAMSEVEAANARLGTLFIDAVEAGCGEAVRLASPRDPRARGSHVCFAHPEGYAVIQALVERRVIGDFRAPDLMRFGIAPLYNSEEDVLRAAAILADVLRTGEWDQPRFRTRSRVT